MLTKVQKEIMQKLVEKGEISNKDLQRDLNLPLSTLYSQLEILTDICVKRKRGKVELTSQPFTDLVSAFHEKLKTDRQEKEEVANYIISKRFIKHGEITLLDCGTTNYIIAEYIVENQMQGLDIITMNPYVLKIFLEYPDVGKVSIVGGLLNWSDGSIYGPFAVDALAKLGEIGIVVLGVDAIDQNGEIGINDPLEIKQKEIMLEKAKKIFIPITLNKLNRAVSYPIGNINKIANQVHIFIAGKFASLPEAVKDIIVSIGRDRFLFTGE
jgi:DeoR/GlpR family transcriptional regulator of sugar metabolism